MITRVMRERPNCRTMHGGPRHEEAYVREIPVAETDAVVVGVGIAGISAVLETQTAGATSCLRGCAFGRMSGRHAAGSARSDG
jgi:hypothetical protein